MLQKIHNWYERGKPPEATSFWEPGQDLYEEGRWTARLANVLVGFWCREWKWIIGTLLALLIALKWIG